MDVITTADEGTGIIVEKGFNAGVPVYSHKYRKHKTEVISLYKEQYLKDGELDWAYASIYASSTCKLKERNFYSYSNSMGIYSQYSEKDGRVKFRTLYSNDSNFRIGKYESISDTLRLPGVNAIPSRRVVASGTGFYDSYRNTILPCAKHLTGNRVKELLKDCDRSLASVTKLLSYSNNSEFITLISKSVFDESIVLSKSIKELLLLAPVFHLAQMTQLVQSRNKFN